MSTIGTNTTESRASDAYRQMVIDSGASDITDTPAISGIPGNFLNASLIAAGLDPTDLPRKIRVDVAEELNHDARPWKDVWTAGHGTGAIKDVLPTADLVARMRNEFDAAAASFMRRSGGW